MKRAANRKVTPRQRPAAGRRVKASVPVDPQAGTDAAGVVAASATPAATSADAAPAAPAATAAPVATAAPAATPTAPAGRAGLKLEPSCLLRDAAELQFQLLAADFGEGAALVDGSAVERVDTAGLQLLVAFVKHHESRGRPVGWTAASPELLRAARQLDLLTAARLDALATGSVP